MKYIKNIQNIIYENNYQNAILQGFLRIFFKVYFINFLYHHKKDKNYPNLFKMLIFI